MLRPPSLQERHTVCWSRDPALELPDALDKPSGDDASDAVARKTWAEWEARVSRARETGDWAGLIRPGEKPTTFELKPMDGTTFRRIADAVSSGKIGPGTLFSLSFRACVRHVENFGDMKCDIKNDPAYGKLDSEELANALDAIHPSIVAELGAYCFERASSPRPKS